MRTSLIAPMLLCCLASAGDLYAQVARLEGPLRAIHISGNWGANRQTAEAWGARRGTASRSSRLRRIPRGAARQLGRHLGRPALRRQHGQHRGACVFAESQRANLLRRRAEATDPEFRNNGFEVYLTLAFESHDAYASARPAQRWQLGDPGHPDTGVPPDDPMYARPILPEYWPWRPSHRDHGRFVQEFWETYTAHAVHFARYERIFQDHVVPLAADNPGRPIVFTEYGAIDTVEGPTEPSGFPKTASRPSQFLELRRRIDTLRRREGRR